MIQRTLACCLIFAASLGATDWTKVPKLPLKLVKDWAQLPRGWNFGETASVAVDAQDNVWVFNRGPHPVIQFDRSGRFLRAWEEVPMSQHTAWRSGRTARCGWWTWPRTG
ncbi:MAG: hypothetical protein R2724_21955 [Bryobacterales bacterium]